MLISTFYTPGGYPAQLYQLSNGHRVLIERRPTDIVSLRTFINTGSIHENPIYSSSLYGKTGFPSGIAHLDEHCHFLTTQNFPQKNSWVAAVQQMGAQLNATTSPEWIQHELAFSREDLPTMIAMHGEAVMRPKYNAEDIHQEKKNVINEAAERTSSPFAKMMNKTWEMMFDRPLFQTLGKKSDIHRTTAEQLKAYYDAYYTPGNMLTVVSGNIDPAVALQSIDQQFGVNAPRTHGDEHLAVQTALKPGEIKSATVFDPTLSMSQVQLAFPAPDKMNARERMAMEFLKLMLGGGPLSLLELGLNQKMNLGHGINVDYSPFNKSGLLEVNFGTQPGKEKEALGAALNLINTVGSQPVTPDRLAELRNRMIYGFKRTLNDVEFSTQMMGLEALTGNLGFYQNFIQLANSINPEDLMNTARKYLSPSRYTVVFGVPGKTATPSGIDDMPDKQGGMR